MKNDEKRTIDLIGRIYEAATEPRLWDGVLRQLVEFVGRPCGGDPLDAAGACNELAAHAADPRLSAVERQRMRAVVPHLVRAVAVSEKLRDSALARETTQASLDCVGCGVVVLGSRGDVLFANHAVRRILDEQDGITLAEVRGQPNGKRLAIEDSGGRAAVDAALAQCLKHQRRAHHGAVVPRSSGRSPYLLRCMALKTRHAHGHDADGARAIVFITDPEAAIVLDTQALQELYGLTDAEASIAERICHGERLGQAARRLKISENTARMHLRSIFHKTAVSRQAELIRLALTLSNCR